MWAGAAAYHSRRAALFFLKTFGVLYFLDGLMGTAIGSGYLDLGVASAGEFMEKRTQFYTESLYEVRWQNVLHLWRGQNFSEGEFQLRKIDGSLHTVWFHWRIILEGANSPLARRTQTIAR